MLPSRTHWYRTLDSTHCTEGRVSLHLFCCGWKVGALSSNFEWQWDAKSFQIMASIFLQCPMTGHYTVNHAGTINHFIWAEPGGKEVPWEIWKISTGVGGGVDTGLKKKTRKRGGWVDMGGSGGGRGMRVKEEKRQWVPRELEELEGGVKLSQENQTRYWSDILNASQALDSIIPYRSPEDPCFNPSYNLKHVRLWDVHFCSSSNYPPPPLSCLSLLQRPLYSALHYTAAPPRLIPSWQVDL